MTYRPPEITAGNTVQAKLLLDHTASGEAHVLIEFVADNGDSMRDYDTAAPGGFCTVTVRPNDEGVIELVVDMTKEGDSGLLIVTENGKEIDRGSLDGDCDWVYSVVKAA